jgi:hypothetical protein
MRGRRRLLPAMGPTRETKRGMSGIGQELRTRHTHRVRSATGILGHALRGRATLLIVAFLWGIYLVLLHPWLMNWGATPEETLKPLPGDERDPSSYFTRGITIQRPPSQVWQWIVQMGQDRAGFYSNTWLENLTGADIHNADTIRPEWQARALGDRVPLARPDLLGGRLARFSHTDIVALAPQRMIANIPGRFVLEPWGERATRLLFRESVASQGPRITRWLVWDPMHFVMVQRMLRGIKERVEGRPLVSSNMAIAARAGWTLAALSLLAVFLARRWWSWLILPVAPTLIPLSMAGDWDAALVGFLATGVTTGGFLAFGRRWWGAYGLVSGCVLLLLLLAPEPYVAFGLIFDLVVAVLIARFFAGRPQEGGPSSNSRRSR